MTDYPVKELVLVAIAIAAAVLFLTVSNNGINSLLSQQGLRPQ